MGSSGRVGQKRMSKSRMQGIIGESELYLQSERPPGIMIHSKPITAWPLPQLQDIQGNLCNRDSSKTSTL